MDNIIILLNYTVNFGQPSFEAMANVVKKVHEILEERNDHNGRNLLLASYIHYTCSLPHPGLVHQCKYYYTSWLYTLYMFPATSWTGTSV